jgi:hypothetical protein
MGRGKIPDHRGEFSKAPYLNFNDGKVRFNTDHVSNPNQNYGSSSAFCPKFLFNEDCSPNGGLLLYRSFVERIHPPSIRPISSKFASVAIYFLLSMAFTSFMSRMNTRRKLSFTLVRSRYGNFSAFEVWLAKRMPSST